MAYEYTSIYLDTPIVNGRVLDIMMPDDVTRDVALFMVHGGGWRAGSRLNYHALARAFHAEGFICCATDYRLSGTTILDQIMDVRHAYDLFVTRLKKMGRDPKIVTLGGSAGAHLNALLSFAEPGDCGEPLQFGGCSYENDWVQPLGAMLTATPTSFEPWEDIFPGIWASMEDIVGTPYAENPELYRAVSPIEHVKDTSCPVLFLEGECEHMFPAEFLQEWVAKAHGLGARAELKMYTRAEHGFFYDVTRRQQKEAFADSLAFIDSL
jgi:acetyl esterase/lipase